MLSRHLGQVPVHAWLRVEPPAAHWRKAWLLLLPLLHRGLPTHHWLLPAPPPLSQGPPRHIPHCRSKPDASHLWGLQQRVASLLHCAKHNSWPVGGRCCWSSASCEGVSRRCYSCWCGSVCDWGRRNIDGNHRVSSSSKSRVGTRTSSPC